jgi:hypothetical protein
MAALRLRSAGEAMSVRILSTVPTLLFIFLVVFLIRRAMGKGSGGVSSGVSLGHPVRRFFQYLLLYGLLVVVATGLSGLLGRLLDRGALVSTDQTELARSVSFTVVGIPLFVGVALWTRRSFREQPAEAKSFGWSFYATLASLTSLSVAMFGLHDLLTWAVRIDNFRGPSLARLVVWGAIWGVHWWLDIRFTPAHRSQVHHLVGSLISLGTVVVGFAGVLSGVFEAVLRLGGHGLFVEGANPILRGGVIFVVGAPVWFLYWTRTAAKSARNPLWLAYVLLAGVGGGLVMAVVSASIVLYQVLVWLLGEPGSSDASVHFQNIHAALGTAGVGIIVWWYHRAVLGEAGGAVRTEVRRVYEYLMGGIGLLAAAGGLLIILVALIESMTGSAVITGGSTVNTLLAAATLLVVGGPVWWFFWRRIQAATRAFPLEEHASPTRRVYLFVLFGVGGIAAVVALLVGVYFLFDDVFKGAVGTQTIRRMRFPIALLIATGAVAGYHWMVYRTEREQVIASVRGPRFVLLVGPKDPELVRAVAHWTGGRVQAWALKDGAAASWSAESVIAILGASKEEELIVLAEPGGPRALPVDRD